MFMHTCDMTRQIVKLPIFMPLSRGHDIEAKKPDKKKILMCFFPDQPFYIFSQKDCLDLLDCLQHSIENSKGLSVNDVIT